jgi:hypothetical protein
MGEHEIYQGGSYFYDGLKHLNQAYAVYAGVLLKYTMKLAPFYWAYATGEQGIVLIIIGRSTRNSDTINKGIAEGSSALRVSGQFGETRETARLRQYLSDATSILQMLH